MILLALTGSAPGARVAAPTGAGFDLVLLAHILAVLVAFGTVAASGVQALRLSAWSRTAERGRLPASLARYYAPGVNWAGRSLHVVPVLGVVLIALSKSAYGYDDLWVQFGLGLWLLCALGAEGVLWPAERRLQRAVAAGGPAPGEGHGFGLALTAAAIEVALVAASVLMVGKP